MSATLSPNSLAVPPLGRPAAIVGSVLLLHVLALWALQRGLVRQPTRRQRRRRSWRR